MFVARQKLVRAVAHQHAMHAERHRVAIHEAGHAITKMALGGDVFVLSIDDRFCSAMDATGDMAGFCLHQPSKGRRQMAVQVAGWLAGQAFGARSSWHDHEYDADRDGLEQLAAHKRITVGEALIAAEARARPIIERFRPAIGAVAHRLVERGTLTGREVREIAGGLPWAA
jgi:ATP-dependent Zn protease